MSRTGITLLCLSMFLLSASATHALTGETLSVGLRKKLFLLTLQGAPIPADLQEDPPFPPLSHEERWQRTQRYLSALTAHAEEIALLSPLAAEDIRTLAADLLSKMETVEEGGQSAFLGKLTKAYREIFPEEEEHSISQLREEGEQLLAEIPDLLALLTLHAGSQAQTPLLEETKRLQAALLYLTDGSDLTLSMSRFDALAASILSLGPPLPPLLLQEDLQELLRTLDAYLRNVEQRGVKIERGALQKLQEELSNVQTEETLNNFLGDLEDFLTTFNNPPTPNP